MPLVRNPLGRHVIVPPGHWALTDPEFEVLPEPEPEPVEVEPESEQVAKPKPRARQARKK